MYPTNDPSAETVKQGRLSLCAGAAFETLSLVLFALLPLHAFLVTWLRFGLHVPGPLNAWKEGAVLLLFVLAAVGFVLNPRKPHFHRLDLTIIVFSGIGLFSSILQVLDLGNASFERIFYGFKYDFLMLAVFLLFRHSPFRTAALPGKAFRIITIVGTAVAAFAVMQATLLPRDFLAMFGYTAAYGTWDPDGPLAIYQALDATHPLTVRAAGTFAGPNQFAMYCLILAGIGIGRLLPKQREKASQEESSSGTGDGRWAMGKLASCLLLLTSTLGLALSYSRSALVGLILAAISLPFLMSSQVSGFVRKRKVSLLAVAIVGSLGIFSSFFLLPSSFLSSVFVRPGSSEGHWTRSIEGAKGILEQPVLGHGIGEAGPASTRIGSGEGWIPENWYLQIGLEYGLIGLIAWLTILFLTAKKLYEKAKSVTTDDWLLSTGLLFSFIAINVACLFLHAWEDSAVAITWWGLAGLVLRKVDRGF